jgi:hypothetical protein
MLRWARSMFDRSQVTSQRSLKGCMGVEFFWMRWIKKSKWGIVRYSLLGEVQRSSLVCHFERGEQKNGLFTTFRGMSQWERN